MFFDLMNETRILGSKPVDIPMGPNLNLAIDKGELLEYPGVYRKLVGKLNYLTMTHSNIPSTTRIISQFMDSSWTSHWNVLCIF